MLKKLALAAAALMIAAPALADHRHRDHRDHRDYRDHREYRGHGHRHVVVHRPAPRPVYVVHHQPRVNPLAVLAGAVIGAAIVHHVITGH